MVDVSIFFAAIHQRAQLTTVPSERYPMLLYVEG